MEAARVSDSPPESLPIPSVRSASSDQHLRLELSFEGSVITENGTDVVNPRKRKRSDSASEEDGEEGSGSSSESFESDRTSSSGSLDREPLSFFEPANLLQKAVAQGKDQNFHDCFICGLYYETDEQLLEHVKQEGFILKNLKTLSDPTCADDVDSAEKAFDDTGEADICEFCGEIVNTSLAKDHFAYHRSLINGKAPTYPKSDGDPFVCTFPSCCYTSDTMVGIIEHIKTHSSEVCRFCSVVHELNEKEHCQHDSDYLRENVAMDSDHSSDVRLLERVIKGVQHSEALKQFGMATCEFCQQLVYFSCILRHAHWHRRVSDFALRAKDNPQNQVFVPPIGFTSDQYVSCDICEVSLTADRLFVHRMNRHFPEKVLKCPMCLQKVKKSEFFAHFFTELQVKESQLVLCLTQTDFADSRIRQIEKVRNDLKKLAPTEESFRCEVCDTILEVSDVEDHLTLHDQMFKDKELAMIFTSFLNSSGDVECTFCDSCMPYNDDSTPAITAHFRFHNEDLPPFRCIWCFSRFKKKDGFLKHLSSHLADFQLREAGKIYPHQIECEKHLGSVDHVLKAAVNELPQSLFPCPICDEKVSWTDLKDHFDFHGYMAGIEGYSYGMNSDDFPARCPFIPCDKSFDTAEDLNEHAKNHHSPFVIQMKIPKVSQYLEQACVLCGFRGKSRKLAKHYQDTHCLDFKTMDTIEVEDCRYRFFTIVLGPDSPCPFCDEYDDDTLAHIEATHNYDFHLLDCKVDYNKVTHDDRSAIEASHPVAEEDNSAAVDLSGADNLVVDPSGDLPAFDDDSPALSGEDLPASDHAEDHLGAGIPASDDDESDDNETLATKAARTSAKTPKVRFTPPKRKSKGKRVKPKVAKRRLLPVNREAIFDAEIEQFPRSIQAYKCLLWSLRRMKLSKKVYQAYTSMRTLQKKSEETPEIVVVGKDAAERRYEECRQTLAQEDEDFHVNLKVSDMQRRTVPSTKKKQKAALRLGGIPESLKTLTPKPLISTSYTSAVIIPTASFKNRRNKINSIGDLHHSLFKLSDSELPAAKQALEAYFDTFDANELTALGDRFNPNFDLPGVWPSNLPIAEEAIGDDGNKFEEFSAMRCRFSKYLSKIKVDRPSDLFEADDIKVQTIEDCEDGVFKVTTLPETRLVGEALRLQELRQVYFGPSIELAGDMQLGDSECLDRYPHLATIKPDHQEAFVLRNSIGPGGYSAKTDSYNVTESSFWKDLAAKNKHDCGRPIIINSNENLFKSPQFIDLNVSGSGSFLSYFDRIPGFTMMGSNMAFSHSIIGWTFPEFGMARSFFNFGPNNMIVYMIHRLQYEEFQTYLKTLAAEMEIDCPMAYQHGQIAIDPRVVMSKGFRVEKVSLDPGDALIVKEGVFLQIAFLGRTTFASAHFLSLEWLYFGFMPFKTCDCSDRINNFSISAYKYRQTLSIIKACIRRNPLTVSMPTNVHCLHCNETFQSCTLLENHLNSYHQMPKLDIPCISKRGLRNTSSASAVLDLTAATESDASGDDSETPDERSEDGENPTAEDSDNQSSDSEN